MYLEGAPVFKDTWSNCVHIGGIVDEFKLSDQKQNKNDTYVESNEIIRIKHPFLGNYMEENLKWLKYACTIGQIDAEETVELIITARFVTKSLLYVCILTIF